MAGDFLSTAGSPLPNRRVELMLAGAVPQRRLTVAFRLILVIPHVIVLAFVSLAALFVVVIGWFAALVTGRFPRWAHEFVGGVVRWVVRVEAYLFLLTDRYPPFSLEDKEYPARPSIPEPGPLNRWAVLFRILLVIPASVFSQIVYYGLTVPLLFVVWLIVLISGQMPESLYQAYAALLRYRGRLNAYLALLTSEYAWGMLGDRDLGPEPSDPWLGADQSPPSTPGPTGPTPPPGWQAAGRPPPVPPPVPPAGSPAGMPPPSSWERASTPGMPSMGAGGTGGSGRVRLVLSGTARAWVIFAIVWGSVIVVGQSVARGSRAHHTPSSALVWRTDSYRAPPPDQLD